MILLGKHCFQSKHLAKKKVEVKANKEGAKIVGVEVAKELKAQNISAAVFDRGGSSYHGVIAALADSIRENGIRM